MVWQAIGSLGLQVAGGLLNNAINKRSSAAANAMNLKDNKALAKYVSDLDIKASKDMLKLEEQYNNRYLSSSSKATQALNQKLMDYQYALERESRQTSYSDTRKDLESAGYNPLLAVGQQSNYTPVSSGVSTQSGQAEAIGQMSELAGVMTDAANSYSANKRNTVMNKNDTLTALSNKALNNANIDWITSKDAGQRIQNAISSATGMETALKNLEEIGSRINLNKKTMKMYESQILHNEYQNLAIQSGIQTSNSAIQATNRANAWHKRNPGWSNFVTGANQIFGSIPSVPIIFKGGNTYNTGGH